MISIHPRVRIGIALIASSIISTFIMNYVQGSSKVSPPSIQLQNITSDFSQSFSQLGKTITEAIQLIYIPSPHSFVSVSSPENQVEPIPIPHTSSSEWMINPTDIPPLPQVFPTTAQSGPITRPPVRTPTASPPIKRPPTTLPTAVPKPTKRPSPTPTPLAPPEYIRPGTSLEDIYKQAGQFSCVPPALLKAFVAQEGPGALSYSDETALFYNAYDWWHRVKETKKICGGYGYHTETGLIPSDSLFAGEKCKEPFNQSTTGYDSGSMGATQILQSYWDKTYKDKVKQKLKVGQADRRVLLDALVGFGLIVIDNTKYSGSCTNWEFKYVIKAACANAGGSCEPYNYCYTICNNYNKYSGKNNNCNNVKDLFVPGSYCQFK